MAFEQELGELRAKGLTLGDCVAVIGVERDADRYASVAQKMYAQEGVLEIDTTTVVSESTGGNYVLAWVWVSDDDAGVNNEAAEPEDAVAN